MGWLGLLLHLLRPAAAGARLVQVQRHQHGRISGMPSCLCRDSCAGQGPHRDLVSVNVGVLTVGVGQCSVPVAQNRVQSVCILDIMCGKAVHSQGVNFDGGLGAAGQGALRAFAGCAQPPQGTRVAGDVLLVLTLELLQTGGTQQADRVKWPRCVID